MQRTDGCAKNKVLVSTAMVLVCMRQIIFTFYRINHTIAQSCNTEQEYENIAVHNNTVYCCSHDIDDLILQPYSKRPAQS